MTVGGSPGNRRRRSSLPTSKARPASIPNIKDPYTHEASVWFEQQLSATMGVRTGFVYKTEDDLIGTFQPGAGPEVFTTPYPFLDIGVDGRTGTADDRTLTFYGHPDGDLQHARPLESSAERRSIRSLQDV